MKWIFSIVLLIGGSVSLVFGQEFRPIPDPPQGNLIEALRAAGNFQTFVRLMEAAGLQGLGDPLSSNLAKGPVTVFAPNDAAFANLPKGTVERLISNPKQLRAFVLMHIVSGNLTGQSPAMAKTDPNKRIGPKTVNALDGSSLDFREKVGILDTNFRGSSKAGITDTSRSGSNAGILDTNVRTTSKAGITDTSRSGSKAGILDTSRNGTTVGILDTSFPAASIRIPAAKVLMSRLFASGSVVFEIDAVLVCPPMN